MLATWTVTDDVLGGICDQIIEVAGETLTHAGGRYKRRARADCPVSDIRSPGYVHLRDSIDFDVDLDSTYHQMWVTFYVIKFYAEFVNNGTSRMAPRPFFTNGVLEVEESYEDLVMRDTRDLRMGRYKVPVTVRT